MAQLQRMKICIIILYCLLYSTFGSPDERRLLKHLFIEQQYNKLERPAQNISEPVTVAIKFTLIQIMDFDPKKQVLVTNAWMVHTWHDYSMTWKPQDFGGITTIRIPSTTIWIPDIVLYNSVDENFNDPTEVNVVIQHTGNITYVPRKIFKSSCSFNTKSIPFDTHSCTLKFGSWTSDSSKINLFFKDGINDIDLSSYVNNTEWDLKGTSASRNTEKYDCCPEIYVDIVFTIRISRRSIDYFTTLNDTIKTNMAGTQHSGNKTENSKIVNKNKKKV